MVVAPLIQYSPSIVPHFFSVVIVKLLRITLTICQTWFSPFIQYSPSVVPHFVSAVIAKLLSHFVIPPFRVSGVACWLQLCKQFSFVEYLWEWQIVSFCFFSCRLAFSSGHLCIAGFTAVRFVFLCVCVFCFVFWPFHFRSKKQESGFLFKCHSLVENHEWTAASFLEIIWKWEAGLPRELHHTQAFANIAPTGLIEYRISGTAITFSTFYSLLT